MKFLRDECNSLLFTYFWNEARKYGYGRTETVTLQTTLYPDSSSFQIFQKAAIQYLTALANICQKVKSKVHFYSAAFAHMPPSAALSSQTWLEFSLGRSSPSPRSRTLTWNHTAARGPSLPSEWSPCKYMDFSEAGGICMNKDLLR